MRYFLFMAMLMLTVGCSHVEIEYPKGGYPYPERIAPADLHQYNYPLKDILNKRDSFSGSYNYLFYEPFDEPNLSIKTQPKESFRLTYTQPLEEDYVITLTEREITVKKGKAAQKYKFHNDSLLTEIEREHYGLLQSRFPIDTLGKDSAQKQVLRGTLKTYPQLLDPYYYKTLFEKSLSSYETVNSKEKFYYIESHIRISKDAYYNWIKKLNAAGYWSLPYHLDSGGDNAMDASSFILEANTKTKYNFVSQTAFWKDESPFAKTCQELINLAGLGKEIAVAVNHIDKED